MDGKEEGGIGDDGGQTYRPYGIHVRESKEKNQKNSTGLEGRSLVRFV